MNEDAVAKALTAALRAVPDGLAAGGRRTVQRLETVTSRPYPPSGPPGGPPALRTGRLESSWRHRVNGDEVTFTNGAPYFGFVELGTRNMAARPAMRIVVRGFGARVISDEVARHMEIAERRSAG